MNLEQFANLAGVTIVACEKEWGGTIAYTTIDHPNVKYCGFRNKQAAYKHWMSETFGENVCKALLTILNK